MKTHAITMNLRGWTMAVAGIHLRGTIATRTALRMRTEMEFVTRLTTVWGLTTGAASAMDLGQFMSVVATTLRKAIVTAPSMWWMRWENAVAIALAILMEMGFAIVSRNWQGWIVYS